MVFYVGLLLLVPLVIQTFLIGWNSLKGLQINLGAKKRRAADASFKRFIPSPHALTLINDLRSLGFERLGETETPLSARNIPMVQVWLDPDRTVQAQLTRTGSFLELSSIFQDKILLVTDYPRGEHITMPAYQSHTITTSVIEAYQYHLDQLRAFRLKFGDPQIIQGMADHLRWETMGRVLYGSTKLKRFLLIDIIGAITFLFILIVITSWIIFSGSTVDISARYDLASPQIRAEWTVILISFLTLLAHWVTCHNLMKQTQRDSRGTKFFSSKEKLV